MPSDANPVLWIIAQPSAPYLRHLDRLPAHVQRFLGATPEAFAEAPAPDCIFLCIPKQEPLRTLWPRVQNMRWMHTLFAGLEHMMFPELQESEVVVSNAQGVFARSLSEYALTSMLYFAKDIPRMLRQQREGNWEPFDVEELHGRTLGIVGYGGIGKATAMRAHAFGMRVLALRRRPEKGKDDPHVDETLPMTELHRLLAESDYVLLSAPQTPDTIGMIGPAELARMKPNAVLINLARGPLVDEAALIQTLQEGKIRGAALDVFNEEPLPAGHPFWTLPNVLLSPHTADHTATWLDEATEVFLENFAKFEKGEPLRNVVEKKMGY